MSKTARTLAAAGLVFAAAFPAVAQDTSIEHVRALIAQAQAQTGGAPQAPAVPNTPFATPGPRVDITIEDAVARGTEKNIDIAVARITPRLTDFTLAGLEASYRLNLTSAASNNRTTDLPRVTTQGISSPTTSVRESWSSGIAQNLWKGGGNYAVNWTNSRFNSPSSVNIRNPPYPDPYGGLSPQTFVVVSAAPNVTILDDEIENAEAKGVTVGFSHELRPNMAVHIDGVFTDVDAVRREPAAVAGFVGAEESVEHAFEIALCIFERIYIRIALNASG